MELERARSKGKRSQPVFSPGRPEKMPGNPGKKERLEGSREVGGGRAHYARR